MAMMLSSGLYWEEMNLAAWFCIDSKTLRRYACDIVVTKSSECPCWAWRSYGPLNELGMTRVIWKHCFYFYILRKYGMLGRLAENLKTASCLYMNLNLWCACLNSSKLFIFRFRETLMQKRNREIVHLMKTLQSAQTAHFFQQCSVTSS